MTHENPIPPHKAETKFLKDYTPTPFDRSDIHINFDIQDVDKVIVTSTQKFKRRAGTPSEAHLILNGENQDQVSAKINGEDAKFVLTPHDMTFDTVPDEFTLEVTSTINPAGNTRLEGLYASNGMLCTQCESEGFRSITYTYDRPDVLSIFTVRIESDKTKFPVLLCNGNRTDEGDLDNNRHFTIWEDPHMKPVYLFALVAGDLAHIHDTFTTSENRKVDLYVYVRAGDEPRAEFALRSLIKSMKWDEDAYGCIYDLDIFNIVAVSDFNYGAMENKSLNIFNAQVVLADIETSTDTDFQRINDVVGHEYFHNWSGNRVTCRDWFQITLKEGLTTVRETDFAAFCMGKSWQRIQDVNFLRQHQFAEDAGPMAHPIRPDSYIEINNFYTATVYEKGCEVIRMMRTLLERTKGKGSYRKGTDLYFSRHDGEAATCEDFVKSLEDANNSDLSLFWNWYTQASTPVVTAKGTYDDNNNTYTLQLSQELNDHIKKPVPVPIVVGLIGSDGKEITEKLCYLTKQADEFVFENVTSKPVPSILRDFSAPVILKHDLTPADLRFLMTHDTDGFNRWECGQSLAMMEIQALQDNPSHTIDSKYIDAWDAVLDSKEEAGLKAQLLALPSLTTVIQSQKISDPKKADDARNALKKALTKSHSTKIRALYDALSKETHDDMLSPKAQGVRALRNLMLGYLSVDINDAVINLVKDQYNKADTMTDRMGALACVSDCETCDTFETLMQDYYDRYNENELALNKWFSLHVSANRSTTMAKIKELIQMDLFKWTNPNRVRSVFGGFAMLNMLQFHSDDGAGYKLLADAIIKLNEINPMIAGRLFTPFRPYKTYCADLRDMMEVQIKRIQVAPNLAPDLQEVIGRTLG